MPKRTKRPVLSADEIRALIKAKESEVLEATPTADFQEMKSLVDQMRVLRMSLDNKLLSSYDTGKRDRFREKARAKGVWVVEILEEEGEL